MRGRGPVIERRVRTLIGVVAVALVVVGCGSDDGTAGSASTTTTVTVLDKPIKVPGALGAFEVAASERWVVGVVKTLQEGSEGTTVAAVDLRNRRTTTFPGPVEGDNLIGIFALVAAGDGFVGVGSRCASPFVDDSCGPTNVLVRLDPAAGTWQTENLQLDPPGLLAGLHAVDDDVILVDWDGESLRVTRIDAAGGVAPIATVSTGTRVWTCVAGDDLWLFGRHSGAGVAYALWRVDLADGATEQIALPELAAYFGGVTTEFGCDATGPVITSTPPGEVPRLDSPPREMEEALTGVVVWQRDGDDWKRFAPESLGTGAVVTRIVSGDKAVLTGGRSASSGNQGFAVLLADGKVTDPPHADDDHYFWWGDTGELLRVTRVGDRRQLEVVG